jgi:hypothetical protein
MIVCRHRRLPQAIALAIALIVMPLALAQGELRTTNTAIACYAGDKVKAAEDANSRHDRLEMDKIGCFPVASGTVAKRVDDGKSDSLWHVILDPDGPSPMDVWGRPSSFRSN